MDPIIFWGIIVLYILAAILQADRFCRIMNADYDMGLAESREWFEIGLSLFVGVSWPFVAARLVLRIFGKFLVWITR